MSTDVASSAHKGLVRFMPVVLLVHAGKQFYQQANMCCFEPARRCHESGDAKGKDADKCLAT